MSNSVDNRIVEMQFDNSHFEKNVGTSLNTLERLKQSLNLNGISKGLEGVNAAAKNCNMNPLAAGVEAVRVKFSALEVMAVTALANITNSAVNAGKRIAKALTIDPIKTGFNEYETKINAIQTIMSNTASKGTTMADVTRVIDELNTYADKTIYNFAEMTRNIGTFTAAGVGLEDSAAAIQGLANLAAASGSSSQQASVAMYQLSQALSSGVVKLQDWNSVVNAGMGGEKFQNALKATAREHGVAVDEIIKKNGSFRESMRDGWMTADILNETLRKFTVEGAAEYAQAMMDSGKWTKEQAEALKAEAQSMEDAATKVKTFSQLWSTLQESAQSGWGKTFELIFGDFEEAKVLFTDLYEIFGGIIDRSSDSRNAIISEAMGGNWDKLITQINEAGMETDTFHKNLEKALKENGHDVAKLKSEYGSLEGIFTSGKLKGSAKILQAALKGATESLIDFNLAGKSIKFGAQGNEVEKVQTALKQLGYDLGKFGEKADGVDGIFGTMTKNAIVAFQKANNLTADGIIGEETLAALDKATTKTETLKGNFDELVSSITEPSGRKLLIDSFMNSLRAIGEVLGVVGKAWDNVFKGFTGKDLKNIISRIHDFTENLGLSEKQAEKLQKTFEGFFTVLKTVKDVIFEVASTVGKFALDLFGPLLDLVLSITSALGGFVKKALGPVSEGFKFLGDAVQPALGLFIKFIDYLSESFVDIAEVIGEKVGEWITKFKELEAVQKISKFFEDASEKIRTALEDISEYIDELKLTPMVKNLAAIGKWVSDAAASIKDSKLVTSMLSGITTAFGAFIGFVKNIKLPDFNTSSFYKFLDSLQSGGILGGLKHLAGIFSFKFTKLKDNTIIKFAEFYAKFSPKIEAGFDACKKVIGKIVEFIFGTKQLSLSDIMDVVEKFLSIAILWETLSIVENISGALDSIGDGIENVGKAVKWRAIGDTFKAIAIALGVLTACIVVLSKMEDPERAKNSAKLLGQLLLVMGGVIAGLLLISKSIKGELNLASAVFSILGISIALAILVGTLKAIDAMDLKNTKQSIGILVGVLISLVGAISLIGRFCGKGTLGSAAAIVTMLAAVKMIPDILQQYDEVNWNAVSSAIPKLVGVLIGLALVLKLATSGIKAGASAAGLAALVLSVVIALKLMLGVIKDFGEMDADQMEQGIKGVMKVLGAITVMLVALNLSNKGGVLKKGEKSINNFKGLAVALLAVVAAIWLLGKMPTDVLIKGGIAAAAILGVMTFVLSTVGKSTKGSSFKSIIAMLVGFAAIIVVMGAVVSSLLAVGSWQDALGMVGALSVLLLAMSFCMTNLTKHKNGAKNIYKWIGAMATFGLVVAELGLILAMLQGVEPLAAIGQVVALSILMNAMSTCLVGLTRHNIKAKNIYKWIGAMAVFGVVVLELGAVLNAIQRLGLDPAQAIGQVAALGLLMLAMSACLAIITALPLNAAKIDNIIVGVAGLALLAAPLYLFAQVLSSMEGMESAIKNAEALSILALALSVALIPLTVVGAFAAAAFTGIIALTAMAVPLLAFVGILALMEGLQNASENVTVLTTLIDALNGMMIVLALAGPLALVGVGALGALATVITKFGVLVAAIGWLMEKFPTIEKFVDGGLEVLKKLASGLGEVIGNFVTSFTGTISENIITVAENLATFAEKLTPFIDTVSSIDDRAISGVASLTDMITALAGAKIVDSLGKTTGIEYYADKLGTFGKGIKDFAESVSGLSEETIGKAKIAAETGEILAGLAKTLSGSGGVWQKFWGEKNLGDFGTQMAGFGKSLVEFSSSITDLSDKDIKHIEKVADAVTPLVTVATSITSTDGLWQKVVGTKDLDGFGSKLVDFAGSLIEFRNAISEAEMTNDDIAKIKAIGEAVGPLADLSTNIAAEDGVWQGIVGTKDFGGFGSKLATFGQGVKDFITATGGIDAGNALTVIGTVGTVIDDLKPVLEKIDTTGGVKGWFSGEKDFGAFGTGLVSLAKGLTDFIDAASEISANEGVSSSVESLKDVVTKINEVVSMLNYDYNTEVLSSVIDSLARLSGIASEMSQVDTSGLGDFAGAMGSMGEAGINAFIQSFTGVGEKLSVAMGTMVSTITSFSPMFTTAGTALMTSLVLGFSTIDVTNNPMQEVINTMLAPLLSYETAFTAGSIFVSNLSAGILLGISGLSATVAAAISATGFVDALKELATTGTNEFIIKLKEAQPKIMLAIHYLFKPINELIKKKGPDIKKEAGNLVDQAVEGAEEKQDALKPIGEALGAGMAEGIASACSAVEDAVAALIEAAVAKAQEVGEINSPSKLFARKIGVAIPEGVALGVNKETRMVVGSVESMTDAALGGTKAALSRLSTFVTDGIDAQPTIRPVLDLSDVSNGVNALSNMFGLTPSVAIAGNISASMANRQNGSNDVVSAIQGLSKKLDTKNGDSYYINGVTYDDGSNVASAVQTLVRAAQIERRI